ncbi:MAG: hypothetical protein KAV45_02475 [Calditrichia bacterium]|nr:hypothetical protein [Calditrichia bacterium]
MGWKGALRSLEAVARSAERDARRRQKELELQQKQIEKLQELERAAYEVELFENRINLLTSIQQDCGNTWNWQKIKSSFPPDRPIKKNTNENIANANLNNFSPNIFLKIFKKVDKIRNQLIENIEVAKKKDEEEYLNALKDYERNCQGWKDEVEFATKIIKGNTEAYIEAINQINPLEEISEIGSDINYFFLDRSTVEVTFNVNSEKVIPNESKSLLKSGKLSIKEMPKGKFYELYQDYVCGCVLRIARELFALLPIEEAVITTMGNLLNTQTGYMEKQSILSVFIPKETLCRLNFQMIDPSDSMNNFKHNMNFKKTTGFQAVEKIRLNNEKSKTNYKSSKVDLNLHFKCPQCGSRYKAENKLMGKKVKCKKCLNIFIVQP